MPGHDIIVVGASAGGVEALRTLAAGLPGDLPAALFVVLHMSPQSPSVLGEILTRAGHLPARQAEDGEPIRHGRIYVARPDYHLLVEEKQVRLVRGPKENRHRPAIDTLFRSAARAHGPRVVGVVFSGALDDGAAGLLAIRQRGGRALVQDPDEAVFADMPLAALDVVGDAESLPVAAIAARLSALSREPARSEADFPLSDQMKIESRIAHMEHSDIELVGKLGQPSAFTCPECNGALWELVDGELLRFRCQVGHAYTGPALIAHQSDALEDSLWAALRALNENAHLARRLERAAVQKRRRHLARHLRARAGQAERHAARLRELIEAMRTSQTASPPVEPETEETA